MIGFSRRTFWQHVLYHFWRPYRERKDAEMREAIKALVANPGASCLVEGEYIPNGYGQHTIRFPWDKP
jgi:hypothetical protein